MSISEFTFAVADFLVINIPFVVLYVMIGFGPGFVAGIILANALFGKGPSYAQTHRKNIKDAAAHNAQWDPKHERWQK